MKKYLIAALIVVALTLFMGKVIYEDHYKAVPVSKQPAKHHRKIFRQ